MNLPLDRTVLNGFARCQEHEVRGGVYRQCTHDLHHFNACEYGAWIPIHPAQTGYAIPQRIRASSQEKEQRS